MRRVTPFLITALILLSGIFLATGILALFFIMMGKIITTWTSFTLFEATILCVAVTFVDAFMIFVFLYISRARSDGFGVWSDDNECDCPPCVANRKHVKEHEPLPLSLRRKNKNKN